MIGEWYNAGLRIKQYIGEDPELPFYYKDIKKGVKQTPLLAIIGNPNYTRKLPKQTNVKINDLEKATLSARNKKLKQIHTPFYMPTFSNLIHEEFLYQREFSLPLVATLSNFVRDKVILITPLEGPKELFEIIYRTIRNAVQSLDYYKFMPNGYEYQALFELLFDLATKYKNKIESLRKRIEYLQNKLNKIKKKREKIKTEEEIKKLEDVVEKLEEDISEKVKLLEKYGDCKWLLIRVKAGTKKIFEQLDIIYVKNEFLGFLNRLAEKINEDISELIIKSFWVNIREYKDLYEDYNHILRNNFFKNILRLTTPNYKVLIEVLHSNFTNIVSKKELPVSKFESKRSIYFIKLLIAEYLNIFMPAEYDIFESLYKIGKELGKAAAKDNNNKTIFYELKMARTKEDFISRLNKFLFDYQIPIYDIKTIKKATLEQLQAYLLLGFVNGYIKNRS